MTIQEQLIALVAEHGLGAVLNAVSGQLPDASDFDQLAEMLGEAASCIDGDTDEDYAD